MKAIDLPKGAVVLNVVQVVEFLDADGERYKQDFSHACDDNEIDQGKYFELLEWARAYNTSQMLMEMVHDHCHCGDDDDDDEVDA